jgi:hypothetical protein
LTWEVKQELHGRQTTRRILSRSCWATSAKMWIANLFARIAVTAFKADEILLTESGNFCKLLLHQTPFLSNPPDVLAQSRLSTRPEDTDETMTEAD